MTLFSQPAVLKRCPHRVNICGVAIDDCTFDEATQTIVEHAREHGAPAYVVTPNAHHVLLLRHNRRLRHVYRHAFLVVADGMSLVWAGQLLGQPLSGRVNGTDLFEKLCEEAARHSLSVFLLGGRPGAAEAAAQVLLERHPRLHVAGCYAPDYGFEEDPEEQSRIQNMLQKARPDILFVGLGAPKQEFWMYDNCRTLGIPVSLGIGVSLEFVAGVVNRAPRWMQVMNLEWFFRLISEPRRLWRRYLISNSTFLWLVLRQFLTVRTLKRSVYNVED